LRGTFLIYAQLHGFITLGAFSVAAVWIILSATGHNTAVKKCLSDFFPANGASTSSSEGQTLCGIFPWVDVGIMGGLWVLLAIAQVWQTQDDWCSMLILLLKLYMLAVVRSYNNSVKSHGHRRINSEYDLNNAAAGSIAMQNRTAAADPWDARESMEAGADARALQQGQYGHLRTDSAAGPEKYAPRSPEGAYTQDPGPTPAHYQTSHGGYSSGMAYPEAIQPHPGWSDWLLRDRPGLTRLTAAEGSFGRKGPRQQASGDHYDDPYRQRQ
jgi:hypothetical protein